jgi:deoxyribonuclease-2
MEDPLSISFFVVVLAGVHILHAEAQGVVEQYGQLPSGRGYGFGFADPSGQDFRLLAKNRHWNRDFWIDHVGPHLKSDIAVETWRRGALPGTDDSDQTHHTTDVLYINVEQLGAPYEWHYTKDHAKWGISETEDWVCVADINRQTSQEKRGGGAICFRNRGLHDSLATLEHLKK